MDNSPSIPYQLSNLSQPSSAPRPTIPYSQFPRTRLSDWQNREEEGEARRSYSTDGSDISLSEDDDMEPTSVSSGVQTSRGGGSLPKAPIPGEGKRSAYTRPDSRHDNDDTHDALSDDDDLNDDEETGLTGKDKQRRGARRTKASHLDQRVVAEGSGSRKGGITAEEKKVADQNVAKRMAINMLLIGLWFVEYLSLYQGNLELTYPGICSPSPSPSTTNGCSTLSTSTSTSLFSRPRCTCSCSLHSPHLSCFSFPDFDQDTIR